MKPLQKQIIKVILLTSSLIFMMIDGRTVQATIDLNTMQEQLSQYTQDMDMNQMTKQDILKVYDELSKQYSPEDIADLLDENAEKLEAQGMSKSIIEIGSNFIRTTDEKSIRNMIENDIDLEEIKEKVEKGYTPEQIVSSMVKEMPNNKKVEMTTKFLLANKMIKMVIIVAIILFIYQTFLRWKIYNKAGKHGFFAIIPFARQIVMYQVCGLSPWLMLFWFIPVLGWFVMLVVAIMKRFCLAKEFGRGSLFGFGLLFFPPIFQSILAFHSKIQKSQEEVEIR